MIWHVRLWVCAELFGYIICSINYTHSLLLRAMRKLVKFANKICNKHYMHSENCSRVDSGQEFFSLLYWSHWICYTSFLFRCYWSSCNVYLYACTYTIQWKRVRERVKRVNSEVFAKGAMKWRRGRIERWKSESGRWEEIENGAEWEAKLGEVRKKREKGRKRGKNKSNQLETSTNQITQANETSEKKTRKMCREQSMKVWTTHERERGTQETNRVMQVVLLETFIHFDIISSYYCQL